MPGCSGVRRSTGQHPGGIIVLPKGEDINTFTPIQHPANDVKTDIVTTHFDYHSIDHNLLKLDELGHDDPTMIRALQDLTGLDPTQIPLDDQKVMSLFTSPEALGLKPEDIFGWKVGSLGIPEFGTGFVETMLIEANPTQFSDLVRIAGLGHGTAVWLGNAQDLIRSGKCTISSAICCRDDIMVYLIHMGLEPGKAFKIMEAVRKGKVAGGECGQWEQWKADMKEHGVPDWYIGSCEKIEYMFPKAHAAAYVMMAWRIAYCKLYYPLEYYAAYFSVRADNFSYGTMCQGKAPLEALMTQMIARSDILTKKEQDILKDMRSVQEMYARGFEFVPIDLNVAQANKFTIVDGKIMPALSSIEGLGVKAAESIAKAVREESILSVDQLKKKAGVGDSVIALLDQFGILDGMPKSDQISLFDEGGVRQ
jgi:DNA polymerase-3 subunit alpha (Gram-positive type)